MQKSLYWKIKAIASKTVYRLFVKYGRNCTEEKRKVFHSIIDEFSIPFLESNLQLVLKTKTNFVADKTLY